MACEHDCEERYEAGDPADGYCAICTRAKLAAAEARIEKLVAAANAVGKDAMRLFDGGSPDGSDYYEIDAEEIDALRQAARAEGGE